MNAKRTDPRVHLFQRPAGHYVPAAGTTPEHLRAVFDAERARLAAAARPRRGRPRRVAAPPSPTGPAAARAARGLTDGPPPENENMHHTIQRLRSYRAHLVPAGIQLSDVEDLADAGKLPTIRLKATAATHHHVTGLAVLRVERVEQHEEA